ncbi:MAG: SPOR domain-containing protein [Gammaproteobacteria bacterium]|nr:SPOR domain-containing protein [Gammaproteobacteria bacterium]MBU1725330.1 SPOR domain-containing protein [Gammaproteobacteria bacterium]MBU2004339.1 SPOR domain-containing protein [Gammaproteobacteria bacterium]
MDNKATTKRMIGAVVLVLVAALLLAALLRSKKQDTPDMAMDNTSETRPILGFPGVGGEEQKPSLVNEDPNAVAQQTQDGSVAGGMDVAGQGASTQGGTTAQSGGGLIPDINLPNMQTATNTTGFDVRPPAGDESRQVVDTDGKVKDGMGNMGGNVAVPSGKAAQTGSTQGGSAAGSQEQQASSGSTQISGGSASSKDKPAEPAPVEKKASKPVLVGEKRVPAAPSAESAAKKAADAKAAADKAAAEKAAAAKSRELAAASGGAGGSFAVQIMASSDKAKADGVAGSLKADGHQVAVSKANVGGKAVYRVQVTGFKNRADASNAQASMKRRYSRNQYVQSSFVTAN